MNKKNILIGVGLLGILAYVAFDTTAKPKTGKPTPTKIKPQPKTIIL